jgi:putative ABC transport system substrate-binding protein
MPLVADAQQPTKVPLIGWLSIASRTPEIAHLLDAFLQGLHELGYVEGQNLAIEYRFAEGKPERLPRYAAELLGLKVDVIVAPNPVGTQAAKLATRAVPIVMLNALDPVGSGLIANLARPGGNITGLTATANPEMVGKYLELLKEMVPKVARVAVLRNPSNPDAATMSREVERAAGALGVQLHVLDVRVPSELDSAFAAIARERPGALLVLATRCSFCTGHGSRTLPSEAESRRLPEAERTQSLASS